MKPRIRYTVIMGVFISLIITSSCSLEIFKDFAVCSVSIAENGTIGTERKPIEIRFTKEIDPLSVEDTLRIENSSFAEVSTVKKVSGDSVLVTPEEDWEPHERFWLIIEKEIQDIYGKNMDVDYCYPFQSTEDILPVSARLVSPKITNGVVAYPSDSVVISFNREVDCSSVEKAFSLSPAVSGYFDWDSDRVCTYHLTEQLRKHNLYTFRIDNACDKNGYSINPFVCSFEYFPNNPLPIVSAVYADGAVIYKPEGKNSYEMEGDMVVIPYGSAEKNSLFRIDFSKDMDATRFRDCFRISPFVEWHEEWMNPRTITILFENDFTIGGYYEIFLSRSFTDIDELEMVHDYIIDIHIDGVTSRFLEFYADSFRDLSIAIGDVELWSGGIKIDSGVESVVLSETVEGSLLTIDYNEGIVASPEVVEARMRIPLRFLHPIYIPVIEEDSLQDSVQLKYIFGGDVFTGEIYTFDWTGANECVVELRNMGNGYVYGFSVRGGSSGVVDEQENYLKDDIEFFFSISLVSSP